MPLIGSIIPYQELLGNYDVIPNVYVLSQIIPYQELLGNYDTVVVSPTSKPIIPYQELLGNYDLYRAGLFDPRYYTIPRAIREL